MAFICNFCNSKLSSKNSLYTHQKQSKSCLIIQGKHSLYACLCGSEFSTKYRFIKHQKMCKHCIEQDLDFKYNLLQEKYKEALKRIAQLEEQLKHKDDTITSLASEAIRNAKPSVLNKTNMYINMLTPLPSQDRINQIIQNGFERKYFIRGQVGLAEFINDSLVKDDENSMYYLVCSDTSRQVFRFKDAHGNVIKDPCMKQFTNMIAEPVKLKTEEHLKTIEDIDSLYIDRAREIAREFYKLNNDNSELSKTMSSLIPNQSKIPE